MRKSKSFRSFWWRFCSITPGKICKQVSGFFHFWCHCTVKRLSMFRLERLSVDTFAIDFDFPGKTFLICDQNFFGWLMLSLSTFLWWFDFAFFIFLLHLFLKILYDFQSSLDLDFLAFLNVWWRLFINFLVSISSHGHGLPFTRFSIWGACVPKTSCK